MQPLGAWNCNRSHSLPCGCPRLHPDFEVPLNEPHSAIKALPPRYSHCCHTGGTVSQFGGVEWSGEGKQAHTSVWMLHHNPKMWSSGICCFFQNAVTLKVYMLLTGKLKWYSANSGQISLKNILFAPVWGRKSESTVCNQSYILNWLTWHYMWFYNILFQNNTELSMFCCCNNKEFMLNFPRGL